MSDADWQQIDNLNRQLLEAERFAREQSMIYAQEQAKYADDPDRDIVIECELICWLREDDPDWREDEDNIVYQNPYISIMKDYDLNEDWNTFRVWNHDPLNGRACCYFMHDLIDHGDLRSSDLLRIGDLSIHVKVTHMQEIPLTSTIKAS